MGDSGVVWALTVAVVAGLALFDYVFHVRKSPVPTLRNALFWSAIYIGAAFAFGIGLLIVRGAGPGLEYFTGYVINEALSVDNLFIFLIIIGRFAVPRDAQQKVLLFGTVFALIARTVFIFLGAAFIAFFNWAFYLFAVVLLITAANLLKPSSTGHTSADPVLVRVARRYLRTSATYDSDRLFTVEDDKRVMTPLLLVAIAVGGTDLLFAFDSIPALFGVTQDVYLVFAATAFSLLGLRQLYFLIDGLLDRLVYLSYGLAAVLGLVGVKLLLEALHANNIPFINHGRPVPVALISTTVSLSAIVVILLITTAVSLLSSRGRARSIAARARRHADDYLNGDHQADPGERERVFAHLLTEESQIDALPTKYRDRIRQEDTLMDLLRRAHRAHDAADPDSPEASG